MAKDFADVPFEEVGGLTISPRTDIPFGKQFRMGMAEYTIYDRAVEQGYDAGIRAHLDFMRDHETTTPAALDDAGFTMMLDAFVPQHLTEHNEAMWRASFIMGWASVYLGLVRVLEN